MMRSHRLLRTLLLSGALAAPRILDAQGTSVNECVSQSLLAGAEGALASLLAPGLPETDVSSVTAVLGLKVVQACTINATVSRRNARYKNLLGREVLQYARLDSLFHHVELVIHAGDAPGTEVTLGGADLRLLTLVPTMLHTDWIRNGEHGAAGNRTTARRGTGLVTGTAMMTQRFGTALGGYGMDRYQAAVEGTETAMEAALTAEDHASDAVALVDRIEAELRRGTPSSGRARQLRALAAIRTAVMTNQRLRSAAALTRTSVDLSMTDGVETPTTRLARGHGGTVLRP
ncbi:MAG: hypothetical protein H3C62_00455 [Gemmatimonadaceae bacterium]|nr:hypothetical protein [Gemmatimonadaceae bacterium]